MLLSKPGRGLACTQPHEKADDPNYDESAKSFERRGLEECG
jgi:hypothetical protein